MTKSFLNSWPLAIFAFLDTMDKKNTKTAGGNRKKNQFLMVTKPSKNWSYNNQFVVTNANINDKIYPII